MKKYKTFKNTPYKSKLFPRIALLAIVSILCLIIMSGPNSFAAKKGSDIKINEVNVYDDDTYSHKCSDSHTIDTNGVNLNASKSNSGFVGAWKINGNSNQEITGSITSGKIMPKDKEGLTPVSFSGNIITNTMGNQGTPQNPHSEPIQISTYCFADDDVYLTFKGNVTSEDLAHVECS